MKPYRENEKPIIDTTARDLRHGRIMWAVGAVMGLTLGLLVAFLEHLSEQRTQRQQHPPPAPASTCQDKFEWVYGGDNAPTVHRCEPGQKMDAVGDAKNIAMAPYIVCRCK